MVEFEAHYIIEAALLSTAEPLPLEQLQRLFPEDARPTPTALLQHLDTLRSLCQSRAIELVEVAGGFRYQARLEAMPQLSRLWEKKAPKASRVFLETLALIAYRQPITRGEIEAIRGVAVNPQILRQFIEREWVEVLGYKDVPGKPALFGTTSQFLNDFNIRSLEELPTLEALKDLEGLSANAGLCS